MRRLFTACALTAMVALAGACGGAASQTAAPPRTTLPASSVSTTSTPSTTSTADLSPVTTVSAPPSSTTTATQGNPSLASIESALCTAVFPNGVGDGNHCAATDLKVSTVEPAWVHAGIGVYNAQDQLDSDADEVVFNLSTHQLIGPTNVGFCGVATGTDQPLPGYDLVPPAVLAGLGLSPCSSSATSPSSSTLVPPPPSQGSITLASFAGAWGAHEMSLLISAGGSAHLTYPDLTLCPSCSFATAPEGTLVFVLRSITNGVAVGSVTASSDPGNGAVGAPVRASLTPGSPGELLQVVIGGKSLVNFCNATSAGQCGA